jgi:hypothetical protein
MALLMFDHLLGCIDGHPNIDDELQRHVDLGYGDGRVGGISGGGAAGSKVWFAKATGCLLIVGARAFLSCGRVEKSLEEKPRQVTQPSTSAARNAPSTSKRRERNTASDTISEYDGA